MIATIKFLTRQATIVIIFYFGYVLGCGNDAQFRDLCVLLEKPDLADDGKYKTNEDRVKNREELINV